MTYLELCDELARLNVVLSHAGDGLVANPPSAVTPELIAALKEHKPRLLQEPILSQPDQVVLFDLRQWRELKCMEARSNPLS